jgi:ABC-2 type transport system permease protein
LNWATFFALLSRDAHVARRNLLPTLSQNLLQPLLLTFVFGRVLTSSGMMQAGYKQILLPGIISISMVMGGIWAVAMPVISEFQFTREIEDRLLAPIEAHWLGVEKIVAGMIQALVGGLVVIPSAWLVMGAGVSLDFGNLGAFLGIAVLVALFSAAGGLLLGCSINQQHIGLMFSMIIAPMMMFGCAYYPWSQLAAFPGLQYAVLINPMVYASEGLRGSLVPQTPHMPLGAIVPVLVALDGIFLVLGIKRFCSKAVS